MKFRTDCPSFSHICHKYIIFSTLPHRHCMSHHQSSLPEPGISGLQESAFPSSRGPRSEAAIFRELRKRVCNEGLGVMAHHPGVTAQQILVYWPAKRARRTSPDPHATFNERIDAVKIALEQNNLTTADFVRKTCASIGGWVSFISQLLEFIPSYNAPRVQPVTKIRTSGEIFECTNLLFFSDNWYAALLQASPFEQRPLGKALPDIHTTCSCHPLGNDLDPKRWLVGHNATEGLAVRKTDVEVRCSSCTRIWRLPTQGMVGVMRNESGRVSIKVPLYKVD